MMLELNSISSILFQETIDKALEDFATRPNYYRRLWDVLEARYDVGLVILDEIDKLDNDNV